MTRRTPPRLQLSLIVVLLLIPASLYAWAREGHEIIAMIAEPRLQPEVRAAVATLLKETSFIGAASWADKVRNEQTAPWHYVNIEITDTEYDAARVCPKAHCVIGQIERFQQRLANEAVNVGKRQKLSITMTVAGMTCR